MAPTDKKAVGPFALGAVARNLGRVFPRSPIISHNPCAEENLALSTGVFVWRRVSMPKGYHRDSVWCVGKFSESKKVGEISPCAV